MNNTFTPLLTTSDWNEEWKDLQNVRRAADDASYWDKRSETFGGTCGALRANPYAERFMELAGAQTGETVFDMGCGTGALSIPYAQAGHPVIAADFSQGMLDVLTRTAETGNVSGITTIRMSWEDNWAKHGVGANAADVAIASRSIATADMRDSLLRLTDVARRRCCITLTTGCSPRTDEHILEAVGVQDIAGRDFLYAFNILVAENIKPEVAYIESSRTDTFADFDDAFASLSRMIYDVCEGRLTSADTHAALERLRVWIGDNLIENEAAGADDSKGRAQGAYRLRTPRKISWAFLAWNK